MFKRLKGDLRTIVVSVVAASVVAGPTAAAAVYVANADKVDNRHAVGAGATTTKRAGKLVATNKAGFLPNNVIRKALNADNLDGLDSSEFLPASGKATDSDSLDGLDSSDFLSASGKATDADELDGRDATELQVLTATKDNWVAVWLGSTSVSYITTTITAPGPGKVVLSGVAEIWLNHTTGTGSHAMVSASRTQGHSDTQGAGDIYIPPSIPTGFHTSTLPFTSTLTVYEAGTHSFNLVASGSTNSRVARGRLTAIYIPD